MKVTKPHIAGAIPLGTHKNRAVWMSDKRSVSPSHLTLRFRIYFALFFQEAMSPSLRQSLCGCSSVFILGTTVFSGRSASGAPQSVGCIFRRTFQKEKNDVSEEFPGVWLAELAENAREAPVYTSGSSQIWEQENSLLHIPGLMTCLHPEGKPNASN